MNFKKATARFPQGKKKEFPNETLWSGKALNLNMGLNFFIQYRFGNCANLFIYDLSTFDK